jgi:hypothetical protein
LHVRIDRHRHLARGDQLRHERVAAAQARLVGGELRNHGEPLVFSHRLGDGGEPRHVRASIPTLPDHFGIEEDRRRISGTSAGATSFVLYDEHVEREARGDVMRCAGTMPAECP